MKHQWTHLGRGLDYYSRGGVMHQATIDILGGKDAEIYKCSECRAVVSDKWEQKFKEGTCEEEKIRRVHDQ